MFLLIIFDCLQKLICEKNLLESKNYTLKIVFSFLNQKTENQIPIAAQKSKENNVSIKYIISTEPANISLVNRPTLIRGIKAVA